MRARTRHSTFGNFCTSLGCFVVPGSSSDVSTGIDFGSCLLWCRPEGVPGNDGVKGGVYAGDIRLLGIPGVGG